MVSALVVHQSIHLLNLNHNYIRTSNCIYCKREKMIKYSNKVRIRNVNRQNVNRPNVNRPNVNRPNVNRPNVNSPNVNSPNVNSQNLDGEQSIIFYFENPVFEEDVVILTTLERLNKNSKLKLNSNKSFCSICQDNIIYFSICREMTCGHIFHQECIDKWLEKNKKCPICRFEI